MKKIDTSDEGVLKRFMQEFFPFNEFMKAGLFTKEMKGDYNAQAKRICTFFGYETVYEYGAKTTSAHISYQKGYWPKDQGFMTVFPSIYE